MPPAKTHRMDLRVTERQNLLIRQAAVVTDRSVSDFVLTSATLEAERALADQRVFSVSEDQFARFQEIVDRPVADMPKLRKLLNRPSPFGKHYAIGSA